MRNIYKTSLTALALTTLLMGCSEKAQENKNVTIAIDSTTTTLDPQNATVGNDMSIARSAYESLFAFNSDMKVIPQLATDYKINDNADVYTINLHPNIKFTDGSPFNATAVKANFDRELTHQLKRSNVVSNVKSVEVVSDLVVAIHLKSPSTTFINSLAHVSQVMESPKLLTHDDTYIRSHPVGTGRFIFKSWENGSKIVFTKNPNYWGEDKAEVDSITFKPVPENGARVSMLKSGQAQVIYPLPVETMDTIKKDEKLSTIAVPSIMIRYFAMNTHVKPFSDVRVRQALNYAFDKTSYIKVVYNGHAKPMQSVLPTKIEGFKAQAPYSYNVDKAKALLKKAGYANGFKTTIWSKDDTRSMNGAQFLQQQLSMLNIKADISPMDSSSHYARARGLKNKPEQNVIIQAAWSASSATADWSIRPLLYSDPAQATANFSLYNNPSIDTQLITGLKTVDKDKKTDIYNNIQKTLWQDAPWIFGATDTSYLAKSKNLSGVSLLPDNTLVIGAVKYTK